MGNTGVGIWQVKQTMRSAQERISLLETLRDNEDAQGTFSSAGASRRVFPDKDIRKEIPDPYPHHITSHPWAEALAVARHRYNRIVLIDGRRLQADYMEPGAYSQLRLNPRKGRVSMN